jgi:hypothetical protein
VRILIISIDHEIQLAKTGSEESLLGESKDRLESLVRRGIMSRRVEFIAEEAHPLKETVAHHVVSTEYPQIRWENIDMSDDERKQAGIYEALNKRPAYARWKGDVCVMVERRIQEDDIREEFFVAKSLEGAGKSESIMILCGDMHARALKNKLAMLHHSVDIDESLITDKRWV